MQTRNDVPIDAGKIANPYMIYGASGFAPLTDEAGVYLPTGPGDAQRMELLNMPGDGSDVWLDVRAVQLYLQISLTSIYKLIHQGEIPAVKLGTKTIHGRRFYQQGRDFHIQTRPKMQRGQVKQCLRTSSASCRGASRSSAASSSSGAPCPSASRSASSRAARR